MERTTVEIDDPVIILRISLAGHDHPITTNHLPNIAITMRPPHVITMAYPLVEFEIHLETRCQLSRIFYNLAKSRAAGAMTQSSRMHLFLFKVAL
jgi:hypothetical protein